MLSILLLGTNINSGKVFISGLDLDGKYRVSAGEVGKLTFGWAATYYSRWDSENPDGTYSPNINSASSFTSGVIPRLKATYSLDWERGPWNAALAYHWQSSYSDICGNSDDNCDANGGPNPPRQVGAYETWDVQGSYAGIKDLKLTAGIKNLFNRTPPYTNAGGAAFFQAGYDPSYADPRGRYLYLNATYKFW
jgi:iron complex outermembrane recepter protein